ncbi:MAG TPA: hypothetical protein VF952_16090 [Chloroflexia bacterium]|jgi:hypothetical protein
MTPPPGSENIIKLTRDTVLSRVRHVFPQLDIEEVMRILDSYGVESNEQERERVQLAILKLSEGSFEKLQHYVAEAKYDFRDVLGPAEYPLYGCHSFSAIERMSVEESGAIQEKDFQ